MIILTKGPVDMDALLGTSAIKLKKAPAIKMPEPDTSPHVYYRFFWNSVKFDALGAIMHVDDLCTCKLECDIREALTWLNDASYRYHVHEDRLQYSEKVPEEEWERAKRYWNDYREYHHEPSGYAFYGQKINRKLDKDSRSKTWETEHLFLYVYDLTAAERFAKRFKMEFTEVEIPWNPKPKPPEPVPAPVAEGVDLWDGEEKQASPGWQFASPTIDTQSAEPPTRRWLSKLFGAEKSSHFRATTDGELY